jgi:hypothetical protein
LLFCFVVIINKQEGISTHEKNEAEEAQCDDELEDDDGLPPLDFINNRKVIYESDSEDSADDDGDK